MNIIQRPAHPTNYAKGRNHAIDQITFHHIVGDAPSGTDHFTTVRPPGKQVSSTYAISSDGTIYQYVSENDTPYTDANALSNSRAITIEHAGPPYAEAMYKASVELCRDIRARHNITRFKRHREVSDVPTACPGELDVERIVNQSGANMPYIEQSVLDDFEAHKKISVALAQSKAWTDMQKLGVKEVADDLWQFKHDHSSEASDQAQAKLNQIKEIVNK
jgi:hypothetical protein